jgi:hypothetical protein
MIYRFEVAIGLLLNWISSFYYYSKVGAAEGELSGNYCKVLCGREF